MGIWFETTPRTPSHCSRSSLLSGEGVGNRPIYVHDWDISDFSCRSGVSLG